MIAVALVIVIVVIVLWRFDPYRVLVAAYCASVVAEFVILLGDAGAGTRFRRPAAPPASR